MKYIQTFEKVGEKLTKAQKKLQDGDYVIISTYNDIFPRLKSFLENNIGEVVNIRKQPIVPSSSTVMVKYYNIPKDLLNHFNVDNDDDTLFYRSTQITNVMYRSKNKKVLEQIILNNKFNI